MRERIRTCVCARALGMISAGGSGPGSSGLIHALFMSHGGRKRIGLRAAAVLLLLHGARFADGLSGFKLGALVQDSEGACHCDGGKSACADGVVRWGGVGWGGAGLG